MIDLMSLKTASLSQYNYSFLPEHLTYALVSDADFILAVTKLALSL